MRRRPLVRSSLLLAVALGSFVASTSRPASAQNLSDADRKAARDLFVQGVELQNKQQFADALDRFQRAQQVVNAPTHLLHIAECQAALGKLVEATETYHQLARWQPSPGQAIPQAFAAAQKQGAGELSQIEPNVPELKVDTVPAPGSIPTLTVTIDDQPINSALVGAYRPVNPGLHKVVASAPGYTRDEKTIDVKEKTRPALTLTLQSTGGVVYGPAGAGAGTGAPVVMGAQGSPAGTAPSATPAAPPPYRDAEESRPADHRSRTSIYFGPRIGAYVPGGNLPLSGSDVQTVSASNVSKTGPGIGVEAALRFARILYFEVLGEYGAFGGQTIGEATYSSSTALIGGKFGINTNPNGVGFVADVGYGYRSFKISGTQGGVTGETTYTGGDFLLGIGIHIKAGSRVRLMPKAELDIGSFSNGSDSTSGIGGGTTVIDTTANKATHVFAFVGLGGYFDIDLDKKRAD